MSNSAQNSIPRGAAGLKKVIIHTDGGCEGNPGPGGWGAILRCGKYCRHVSGGSPATTNNRMELQAALGALSLLKEPCEVELYTDSQYLRQGITQWMKNWKRRGWLTLAKKPVKNEDLWRALDAAVQPHRIDWKWLKGHAGHADNERCDELARKATAKICATYTKAERQRLLAEFKAQNAGQTEE